MKKYILIAGVNGAGKSTLYQSLESLKDYNRVNTDEVVRSQGDWRNAADVIKAGKVSVRRIRDYFERGISFDQETTLCGSGILRNVRKAKALGYVVELHYVGVESAEIAKERIAYRVQHGGHGIPDADVERRYLKSFRNLKRIMDICDLVVLYDNTEVFNRFAIFQNGKLLSLSDQHPEWYDRLMQMEI